MWLRVVKYDIKHILKIVCILCKVYNMQTFFGFILDTIFIILSAGKGSCIRLISKRIAVFVWWTLFNKLLFFVAGDL